MFSILLLVRRSFKASLAEMQIVFGLRSVCSNDKCSSDPINTEMSVLVMSSVELFSLLQRYVPSRKFRTSCTQSDVGFTSGQSPCMVDFRHISRCGPAIGGESGLLE